MHRETGILLPNNQRQHRTSHAPKDVLPLRIWACTLSRSGEGGEGRSGRGRIRCKRLDAGPARVRGPVMCEALGQIGQAEPASGHLLDCMQGAGVPRS